MNEATSTSTQPERLLWDDICKRYPSEWVVLVDLERSKDDDEYEFGLSTVWGHSPNRREAYVVAKSAHDSFDEVACRFTGELVPNLTFR